MTTRDQLDTLNARITLWESEASKPRGNKEPIQVWHDRKKETLARASEARAELSEIVEGCWR